ncbi:oligosaccharyl transferase, archaeosortase A system-associated [Archaeoglobus veneficus]|uniref:dolichyl-phosphooligosaccharide-protein glycotransferase n=1 Tax=Archaeoglobus veneficus (strain DSM 11195 / SNP6) TaxID=693661 RepID=F2KQM9_ARCVS|nr:oligosaccharyl transferase, archaeosortase A system-associated [Archaeoglobus veneficus]AEA46591.1 Oligosaccharyl transferase STT3 subunit [Archaeoglobus veneficus SNP6]
MTGKNVLEKNWHWLFLGVAAIVSLYLRIINPWNSVFVSWIEGARLSGNDPWYYFRLIDSCIHNFPSRIWFDAFTYYPYGTYLHFGPFLVYLGTLVSFVAGAGDAASIRSVIAFIPAIGGTLLAFPVYLLTREISGKKAGVIASLLVVIIPGQLMARSVLGFNDHHIWEVFWMTSTLALFAYSINLWSGRSAKENLSDKSKLLAPVLTGIALGLYLDTWAPGFIVALMLLVYAFFVFIVKKYLKAETENLVYIGIITFLVASIIYLPFSFVYHGLNTVYYSPFQLIILLGSALVLAIFHGIEILEKRGYYSRLGIKEDYAFPATIAVSAAVVVGAITAVSPDFLNLLTRIIGVVQPKGGALTIAEVQPFFTMGGEFSLAPAWSNFAMTFFFAIPGMVYTAYRLVKERKSLYLLVLVWGVAMLIALTGQNRFAYYFGAVSAVFAAVMLEYFLRLYANYAVEKKFTRVYALSVLWFAAFLILRANPEYFLFALLLLVPALADAFLNLGGYATREWPDLDKLVDVLKRAKNQASVLAVVALLLFSALVLVYPTFAQANMQSKYAGGGINKEWYDALTWMRENTPGKDFYDEYYYELYEPGKPGEPYPYPEGTYGVMSWWDYGHWITAIAHRIPNANPFQQGIGNKYANQPGAAPFFTAFNESYANAIADRLGVKYVITDVEMATGKFYAMAVWAEGSLDRAGQMYYAGVGYVYQTPQGLGIAFNRFAVPTGAQIIRVLNVPSENYYRTMEARFHIFDGNGLQHYRMVYESGFVSIRSPMGFDEMMYRNIYNSVYANSIGLPKVNVTPTGYVKIFEYVKGAKITGKAPAGVDEVTIKATVTTNQNRTFVYEQKAKVENGVYEFIVPYAQNTKYPVKVSEYVITAGSVTKTVSITDEDVENGKVITLDFV